jgi:hypothetical protein
VRGKTEAKPTDSDKVTIGNSPPIINLISIPPFDVPGEFRYNITAEDPDGDTLTYRLLEPLDRGIVIDRKSGVLKWYITEAPTAEDNQGESTESDIPAIPGSIKIVFEVSDSDDATAIGSIDINLAKGSEVGI